MALSKSIDTVFGVPVVDAYHRVEGIELVSKSQMAFSVRAYASTAHASVADARYVAPYDMDGENPIRQAYMYLKSMPGFENATDC